MNDEDKNTTKKVSKLLDKIKAKDIGEEKKFGSLRKSMADEPMTKEFEEALKIFFGEDLWKMKHRRMN